MNRRNFMRLCAVMSGAAVVVPTTELLASAPVDVPSDDRMMEFITKSWLKLSYDDRMVVWRSIWGIEQQYSKPTASMKETFFDTLDMFPDVKAYWGSIRPEDFEDKGA